MKKARISRHLKQRNQALPPPIVGVTWYTEQEWAGVKATATDPKRFEATFPEWVTMAEEALAKMRRAGISPVKILVTANDLLAWCLLHKKENNAGARAQFVSERNRAQHEAGASLKKLKRELSS